MSLHAIFTTIRFWLNCVLASTYSATDNLLLVLSSFQSTNIRGPCRKRLRLHLPEFPTKCAAWNVAFRIFGHKVRNKLQALYLLASCMVPTSRFEREFCAFSAYALTLCYVSICSRSFSGYQAVLVALTLIAFQFAWNSALPTGQCVIWIGHIVLYPFRYNVPVLCRLWDLAAPK